MSDWPSSLVSPSSQVIHTTSFATAVGGTLASRATSFAAGNAWPANNRAIYIPFSVDVPLTVFQMAVEVTTQSGNLDLGIYTEQGVRLVSAGSTAVGAAGIQTVNITDTTLSPGTYFMAMSCSTTAAAFTSGTNVVALLLQVCGVQQEALGSVTLPDPATFANPASAYIPGITMALKSTI